MLDCGTPHAPAIDRLSLAAKQLLSNLYGTLLKLGLLDINLQS